MSQIGTLSLKGLYDENWVFTVGLAAGITINDIGKPVTIDTSAENTVKLAGENMVIVGQLLSVEDRKQEGILVGAVAFKGAFEFPTTGTVAVGDTLDGSTTPGVAKKATTADWAKNVVVEVGTGTAVVIKG